MTQQAKDFILYMYRQFPATVGHIPMKEMIEKIEQAIRLSTLDEAAAECFDVARQEKIRTGKDNDYQIGAYNCGKATLSLKQKKL